MNKPVSEIMTRDVVTITGKMPIGEFVEMVEDRHFSGLPVVDDAGRAVGLVSQNDVLRGLAYRHADDELPGEFQSGKRRAAKRLLKVTPGEERVVALSEFLSRPVSEVMTPKVVSCSPETTLSDVCATMASRRIRRVVVLDEGGKVAGIVTAMDLVRHFAEELATGERP